MSHNMLGQQFELYGVKYKGGEQARADMPNGQYHGTDEGSSRSMERVGQRATFAALPQTYGPGFYVTPNQYEASAYARRAAKQTGRPPTVELGEVDATNPASMDHEQLTEIGARYRAANPRLANHPMTDADLGNIALRQAGHDYLHINYKGDRFIDNGIVLRPKKWRVDEVGDPID